MEVLKKIELKDYYTNIYEDSSSLERYWLENENRKKFLFDSNFDSEDSFIDSNPSEFLNGIEWKLKKELGTEEAFLENYGNPVASVRLKKLLLVLEKSEDKISLKFFVYINQRNVGAKWFTKTTSLTYATYNFRTNCFYYGSSLDYHKKKKKKGRSFSKNSFYKKSLDGLAKHLKNLLSYIIIPDLKLKDEKNKLIDDFFINFLQNIPGLKYNSLLSFDENLYKNYLDLNNIKYPNNWNSFMELSPLPLKREYKKNGNRLVDTIMFKNDLKGDKIKKLLHLCTKLNTTYIKEVFDFFGEDFVRSQDDKILLKMLEMTNNHSFKNYESIGNKKCKHNAFSVYGNMILEDDIQYSFMDHIRMYHFLNKFEVVRWKSKTIEEFKKEHLDWSNKQAFYTKGRYNRLYPDGFINSIKSLDLDGYYPVLLKNSDEYNDESSKQSNCVKTYINRAESLIISLRKDCPEGEERATIEYKIFGGNNNKMKLWRTQTLGRFNQRLSSEWDKPIEMLDKGIYKMINDGMLGLFNVEVEIGHKKIISGTKFNEENNNYLCWTETSINSIGNNIFLNF